MEGQAWLQSNRELYGKRWKEVAQLWYDLWLDDQAERTDSEHLMVQVFQHYLRECNYTDHCPKPDELMDDQVLLEPDELAKYSYEIIPEITRMELTELMQKRCSSDPNVPRLDDWEKAQIERFYFDSSLVTNLPEKRRAELWKYYQKLGRDRFSQIRFELGLKTTALTMEELLCEGRADLWNDGKALKITTIMELLSYLGIRSTLTAHEIPRDKFLELIEAPRFGELVSKGTKVFKTQHRSKSEKMTSARAIDVINSWFNRWSGSTLAAGPRKRQRVNGKLCDVAPIVLQPLDLEMLNHIQPRASKAAETARITQWNLEHDQAVLAKRPKQVEANEPLGAAEEMRAIGIAQATEANLQLQEALA